MRYMTILAALVVTLCVPSAATASSTYTIRPGDSLWLIAARHDVALADLLAANGLALSSTIHPGRSLTIPGQTQGGDADASQRGTSEDPNGASGASATVRPGDSLWSVATRAGVSLGALLAANSLTIDSTIHPGQSLAVPDATGATGGSARTQPTTSATTTFTTTSTPNYIVRPGEGLTTIARRLGVGVRALLDTNALSMTSVIHPGQSLVVPGGSASTGGSAATATTTATTKSRPTSTYVVRPGDGLTTVARRVGVGVRALLDANALSMTTIIHPGQRLTIPESSVPAQVAQSEYLVPIFERAAAEAGIPADLLMAVAYVESRWVESARSPDGAVGVGQLMPGTAAWVARDLMGEPGLDIGNTTDNIRISAHLLKWLLSEAGGSADRALAMYLQGVHGVQANGVSSAAVVYADRVAGIRPRFQ